MKLRPFTKDEIPFGKMIRWLSNKQNQYVICRPKSPMHVFDVYDLSSGYATVYRYAEGNLASLLEWAEYLDNDKWIPFGVAVLGRPKMYNHMMDVGFTIVSTKKNSSDISPDCMIRALERRIEYLKSHPAECAEAFGHCDTYEVEGG